jgi:hypothetical protein
VIVDEELGETKVLTKVREAVTDGAGNKSAERTSHHLYHVTGCVSKRAAC